MTEITQADRDAAAQYDVVEAFARHRMEERAAIVAWLRKEAPAALHDPRMVADAIEAGEHLK